MWTRPTWARARRPAPFAVVVRISRRVNCTGVWLILVSLHGVVADGIGPGSAGTTRCHRAARRRPNCSRAGGARPSAGAAVAGAPGGYRGSRRSATMGVPMSWEDQAANWLAWARTPGHDAYWSYREAFFPLLPAPGRRTLEVGCGEGRVARDLAARGHRVVGLDSAPTLVRHAAVADAGGRYVRADAAALPFGDGAFDLVVAYNSLMDVDDMPGSVREAGRVLEPGGHLGFCVTHPFMDAGRFASREADAAFVVSGSYLGPPRPYQGTFARAGLEITFHGWVYPLEAYARAFEAAGFLVETLREPADPRDGESRGRRLPWFLMGRCVKRR